VSKKVKGSWIEFIKANWYFVSNQRKKFVFWSIMLFVVGFAQFASPYLLGKTIDFLVGYEQGTSLTMLFVYIGAGSAVVAAAAVIRLTGKRKLGEVTYNTIYSVKTEGFNRLMRFSISWHSKMNTGNKVKKIESGTDAISDTQKMMYSYLYGLITGIAGNLILFGRIGIGYLGFVIGYLVILYGIYAYFIGRYRRIVNLINASKEKASGTYYEGISNVLAVKSMGATGNIQGAVQNREAKTKALLMERVRLVNTKWIIMQVFGAVCGGLILYLLSRDVISGMATIGMVMMYASYFGALHGAVTDSTNYLDEFVDNRNAVVRMMPIFNRIEKTAGERKMQPDWKVLEVNEGSFKYKSGKQEFKIENVSIQIGNSQKLGFVGRSGSGKSTLVKILLGLYHLQRGEYLIDGIPFEQYDSDSILERFSIVLQESELFNYSLRDNITMLKKVSAELLDEAVEISQLKLVAGKLPQGLDTLIGEKGYALSGGERQRIGIARAVVMNPDLLILDEATSNLDSITEQKVMDQLLKYFEKKTLIIIAHRLSTLKNVEKVYVFEKGRIVEEGAFKELVNNPGSRFTEMYKAQSQTKEK